MSELLVFFCRHLFAALFLVAFLCLIQPKYPERSEFGEVRAGTNSVSPAPEMALGMEGVLALEQIWMGKAERLKGTWPQTEKDRKRYAAALNP